MHRAPESWLRDLRQAARAWGRRPGAALIATLVLALGIGAAAAVFSLAESVLFRPLPYPHPDALYLLRESIHWGPHSYPDLPVAAGNLLEWRRQARGFASLALFEPTTANLDLGDRAVQVHGGRVSSDFLPMLGALPWRGRNFLPQEQLPGRDREVLLSIGLWRSEFGSDPAIVGRQIVLGGYSYLVVGLLPASFYFPRPSYLYRIPIAGWDAPIQYLVPLGLRDYELRSGIAHFNFIALGRLRPGATAGAAVSELNAIESGIARRDGHGAQLAAEILPLRQALVGPFAGGLWMLLGAALLLLLVVAAVLGGLALVRRLEEGHEWAVRSSLGAGRADRVRRALAEGSLLAAGALLIGLPCAIWASKLLAHTAALALPRLSGAGLDGRGAAVAVILAFAIAALCALLSFAGGKRQSLAETLQGGGQRATAGAGQERWRAGLAAAEVALAAVLVVFALLLGRSLSRMLRANNWLRSDRAITLELELPPNHYAQVELRQQAIAALQAHIAALPGVAAAGFTNALPLRGQRWVDLLSFTELPMPEARRPAADFRTVTPGFFPAIGLPLQSGRFLAESDRGQAVAVVSAAVARTLLAGRDPLGMHVAWNSPVTGKPLPLRVVGVVGDARTRAAAAAPLTVYLPNWLFAGNEAWLVARARGDPDALAGAVRAVVRRQDPMIAMPHEETLAAVVGEAVAPQRFLLRLGAAFALFTAFLAALGLYGVIAVSVRQRRREIGLRLALGAPPAAMWWRELRRGLLIAAPGLVAGLAAAQAAGRWLASAVPGVSAGGFAVPAAAGAILLAVAALASALPARRAARTDPLSALREP